MYVDLACVVNKVAEHGFINAITNSILLKISHKYFKKGIFLKLPQLRLVKNSFKR